MQKTNKKPVTLNCVYPYSLSEREKSIIIKTAKLGRYLLKWDMRIGICLTEYVSWKNCRSRGATGRRISRYDLIMLRTDYAAFLAAYMLYHAYMEDKGFIRGMAEEDIEIKCYAFAFVVMEEIVRRNKLRRIDYIPRRLHCVMENRGLFRHKDENGVPYILAYEAEELRKDFGMKKEG